MMEIMEKFMQKMLTGKNSKLHVILNICFEDTRVILLGLQIRYKIRRQGYQQVKLYLLVTEPKPKIDQTIT